MYGAGHLPAGHGGSHCHGNYQGEGKLQAHYMIILHALHALMMGVFVTTCTYM